MRIVTFNNNGSGHLLGGNNFTLCGWHWPGTRGELEIREPQDPNYPRGRHVVAHPLDGKLHLCGNCEKVVESRGYEAA